MNPNSGSADDSLNPDNSRQHFKAVRISLFCCILLFILVIGFYHYRSNTTEHNRTFSLKQQEVSGRILTLVRQEFINLTRTLDTLAQLPDSKTGRALLQSYLSRYIREQGVLAGFVRYNLSSGTEVDRLITNPEFVSDAVVRQFQSGAYRMQDNTGSDRFQLYFVRFPNGSYSAVSAGITGPFRDQVLLLFFDMKSLRQHVITCLVKQNTLGMLLVDSSGMVIFNSHYPETTGKNFDAFADGGARLLQEQNPATRRGMKILNLAGDNGEPFLFSWMKTALVNQTVTAVMYTPMRSVTEQFKQPGLLVYFLLILLLIAGSVLLIQAGRFHLKKNETGFMQVKLLNLQDEMQELRRTHARYNTLLNSMMVGIVMSNSEGRIIDCNQTFAEMLGYEMQELLGVNQKNLTPPKYWHEESGSIQKQLLRWGFTRDYEKEFIRKDGSLVPVMMNTTLVHDEEVQGTIMLSTLQDISAKKRADREIEKLHTHLEDIIESSPSAIITLDEQHKITSMNAAAERFFSVKRNELQRRQLQEAIPFFKKYEEQINTTIRNKRNITLTAESFSVGEHEVKYTNITLYPLHEEESGTIAIHLEDISEQVRLEKQLYQSQKMEAMGTLASGFAHDFNNLLSGIYSYLSVLKLKMNDPELLKTVQTIHAIAQRASSLVKHILTFSRSGEVAAEPVNLKEVCIEVEEIVSRSVDKNIHITKSFTEGDCYILGDPTQISQVMMNLCINARDALPGGGEIRIVLEKVMISHNDLHRLHLLEPGEMARITVEDNGSGIEPAILDKIFDPFFTTKSKGKGTGLGLSIVYGILRSHRGDIEVISSPGKGTKIMIYLPLADIRDRTEAQPVEAAFFEDKEAFAGKGTVLVIDDEEVICNAIKEGFNRLGFRVLTANSGEDGIALYRSGQVDIVLLDMIMPGMTGEETFYKLREIDPAVKVVVQTGYTQPDSERRMRENGVLAVFHKPYDIIEVARAVSGYITA